MTQIANSSGEASGSSGSKRQPRTRAKIRSAGVRRSVFLLVIVAMLLTIGLGAMLSASSVVSINANEGQFELFSKQMLWVGIGLGALVITSFIPYHMWQKFALPIYTLVVFGLVITLIVGDTRGGATRWIVVGPITVQLAEFSKFATLSLLAAVVTKKDALVTDLRHVIVPVGAILGTVSLLLLAQPDFGNVLLIVVPAFVMLAASTVPLRFVLSMAGLGAIVMTAIAMSADYRKARFSGFLDPFENAKGSGLQAVQSMVALGTGGMFGVGLGQSRARWLWLPNAHTDFIFAIIGEETGFAGAFIVITLFALIGVVGVSIAYRAPDMYGRLLAIGIVAWLSVQALVNIGGVVAVLPITGVPLPFISSGGNAMLANLAAIGVLLNISRSSDRLESKQRAS
ncbi:MAG: stage V sporulation protein E [Actinobacteria bacterium]|nr:MAG: stage V sporulation protein E [Actinomycetota bacterium]